MKRIKRWFKYIGMRIALVYVKYRARKFIHKYRHFTPMNNLYWIIYKELLRYERKRK